MFCELYTGHTVKYIFVSDHLKIFLNPRIETEQSKVPKAVISMKDLNAVFQPEKISHAHGLQISYLHGERMRNLFVYHENGQVSSSPSVIFYFHLNVLTWQMRTVSHGHQISACVEPSCESQLVAQSEKN